MNELTGLEPGTRYRCDGCGNLTRFDIETTERVRRFWHVDLGGEGQVEEEVRDVEVESVTCRWCGHGTRVDVEVAPVAKAEGAVEGDSA